MIKIDTKTKQKASLKLYNNINSYLFEQQYDELKGCSTADIEKLKEAASVLVKIINRK